MEKQKGTVQVRIVRNGYLCVVKTREIERNVSDDGLRLYEGEKAFDQLTTNLSIWDLEVEVEDTQLRGRLSAAVPDLKVI